MQKVEWNNSRLVKDGIAEEITRMKQEPGKDMVIYGSGSIVSALTNPGLIDEYRIFINPVVLGKGKPLHKDLKARISLKLIKAKMFHSGLVCLCYQPDK